MLESKINQFPLLPERHPAKDFFIADIFDNLPFKDDIASMEHPIFTLSKKKDIRNLEYQNGDITIFIKPNTDGLPNIFDKDILLYCGSILMEELNKGNIPPKTLRVSSHDLLVATNRPTNGKGYMLLKKALDRLKGVTIKTNIKTNKREINKAFGLIDGYEIIESSRVKDRMVRLEITLSDWFYNSVLGKEVLTINKQYFRLGKALERRLYEIARKHCGKKNSWKIGLEKLKGKTGSTSPLNKFRYFIREIAKTNHIPDYKISIDEKDIITFQNKKDEIVIGIEDLPRINTETIERGRQIVFNGGGSEILYNRIRTEFTKQLFTGFKPDNVDGAFIGFVKKKMANFE